MEHKTCVGCRWNNYPICDGTIMGSGDEMNIEKLSINFRCGQKYLLDVSDYSIKPTEIELLQQEVLDLKLRIENLEES